MMVKWVIEETKEERLSIFLPAELVAFIKEDAAKRLSTKSAVAREILAKHYARKRRDGGTANRA